MDSKKECKRKQHSLLIVFRCLGDWVMAEMQNTGKGRLESLESTWATIQLKDQNTSIFKRVS